LEEVVYPSEHCVEHGDRVRGVHLQNGRVETHLSAVQFQFHFENRGQFVFLNVGRIDLFIKMFQGGLHGLRDSLQHDFVDIVHVGFPNGRFLIDVDFGMYFSHQLVDLIAVVLYELLFGGEYCLVLCVVVLDSHRPILPLEHLYIYVLETGLDFTHSLLHNLNDFEGAVDLLFGHRNELVYVVRLPFQEVKSGCQGHIHFLNAVFNEGLFHGMQTGDYFIIAAGQEVQTHDLLSELLILIVDLRGLQRDTQIQEFEIPDFSQKTGESWIEIHSDDSHVVFC